MRLPPIRFPVASSFLVARWQYLIAAALLLGTLGYVGAALRTTFFSRSTSRSVDAGPSGEVIRAVLPREDAEPTSLPQEAQPRPAADVRQFQPVHPVPADAVSALPSPRVRVPSVVFRSPEPIPVPRAPVQEAPVPAVPVPVAPAREVSVPAATVPAATVPAVPVQEVSVPVPPVPAVPVQEVSVPVPPAPAAPVQEVSVPAAPVPAAGAMPAPSPVAPPAAAPPPSAAASPQEILPDATALSLEPLASEFSPSGPAAPIDHAPVEILPLDVSPPASDALDVSPAVPLPPVAGPQVAAPALAGPRPSPLGVRFPALPRTAAFFSQQQALGTTSPGPKEIALTFDDGPWPVSTAGILADAARQKVPLTFFVIGRQVHSHAALLKQMLAAGHEIGSHTWDHPLTPVAQSLAGWELAATDRAIWEATGQVPHLMRAPGGHLDSGVAWAAQQRGQQVIGWSVDSRDWAGGVSARALAARVVAAARPGAVVLMHDGGGNRAVTVAAFPMIVDALRAQGYVFVTVSQLGGF